MKSVNAGTRFHFGKPYHWATVNGALSLRPGFDPSDLPIEHWLGD